MKTMKKTLMILLLASVTILTACEGPRGPMGPAGEDGYDGVGTVFEMEGTFSSGNEYTLYYAFPNDFTMIDGDVVMVYILWEINNGLDVWRPLPQTRYLDAGILQYSFDYTLGDVQIYLDGTVAPVDLLPGDTDNQVFRIAVLPADLYQANKVDLNDFNAVMHLAKMSDKPMTLIAPDQVKTLK